MKMTNLTNREKNMNKQQQYAYYMWGKRANKVLNTFNHETGYDKQPISDQINNK